MRQNRLIQAPTRDTVGDILQCYDDQVLTTLGFGSTVIEDQSLQAHICQIWHLGLTWELWRMVSHVIAGAHDLFYTAGVELDAPLIQDLEFLRELADTRRRMTDQALAERIENEALQDIAL